MLAKVCSLVFAVEVLSCTSRPHKTADTFADRSAVAKTVFIDVSTV